jgi:phage terminase large subunit-like protein
MSLPERIIQFLESLKVPTGPLAGEPIKLADFQRTFIRGAFADGIEIGVLSVARGAGKSTLGGGLALAGLMGFLNNETKREVLLAARVREQSRICYEYVVGLIESLPDHERERFTILRPPRLEIRYEAEGGPHYLKALASDGRSVLGSSPTFIVCDERAFWHQAKGDTLEGSLLTGMTKRGGRAVMISTSGPDDLNSFSRWLDQDTAGVFRQEHRPAPNLPADDEQSLLEANPGSLEGIGPTLPDLKKAAARAIDRGGSALNQFRLLSRNERVHDESRAVLCTVDQWLEVECAEPPAREGICVIGIDSAESASMAAACYYWPTTGRLEAHAWFPAEPGLLDRGGSDQCGDRYERMRKRGELSLIGQRTIPVREWLPAVIARVQGQQIACIVSDRFKQSQIEEGVQQAGISVPIVWRRFGFFDGSEDCNRLRNAILDKQIKVAPSLLMRSAISDCVIEKDVNLNERLAKARSAGRIDAVSAAVLAVAQGQRMAAQPKPRAPRVSWA